MKKNTHRVQSSSYSGKVGEGKELGGHPGGFKASRMYYVLDCVVRHGFRFVIPYTFHVVLCILLCIYVKYFIIRKMI